jgi:hypothetical protein
VFSDAAQLPEANSTKVQDAQFLVDSINAALNDASSKARAPTAAVKQMHSLGSMLDGFNDRVAELEKSENGRMEAFREIR